MIAPSVMNLTAVPAFSDNYIWMIDDGRNAIVVDPGEAGPVEAALDARRLALAAILVTHHHADHVGGVDALRARLRGPVFGPAHELVPQPCEGHVEGDVVEALGLRFEVVDVPGHTAGHIAYFNREGAGEPIVFCGDTLFSAGCGKLFEGTPAQMHASLAKLSALPDATRVCCGHEYTVANLRFAHAVEPGNADVARHIDACKALRAAGKPTVPSPIGRERRINPFLRCAEPAVIDAAVAHGASGRSGSEVLAAIRTWKNEFR
jgi:hydroxyacylglutathione hydrolase